MFNTKKIHPAWNMMIVFMFIHAGTAGIIGLLSDTDLVFRSGSRGYQSFVFQI